MRRTMVIVVAGLLVVRAAIGDARLSRTEEIFWTPCTVTLYDHADKSILDACFDRLREIHHRMSLNVAGSELEAVSAAAGQAPVHVTDDVLTIARSALRFAEISGGLFDPTVGPLMKVWKLDKDHPDVPGEADIAAARALVNWRDVVVDYGAKTIFLKRPGMSLDFGGLLKGYAADEAGRILSARGVKSAIIDLGGDILALGERQGGQPWRIGVQNPEAERGVFLGIARVMDKAVVTSGVYEHFFMKGGRRYHHIMNTQTGYPVDNGLESVTIITKSSMDADGLGLALFCMGVQKGIELGEKLGLGVVMVGGDHRVYVTPETKAFFTITDPGFRYAN